MIDLNDWRLQGQEHLKGEILFFKHYSASKYLPDLDHDHCEFCGTKFSLTIEDALKEGYCTEDTYHWICPECFQDFKEMFMFKVGNPSN